MVWHLLLQGTKDTRNPIIQYKCRNHHGGTTMKKLSLVFLLLLTFQFSVIYAFEVKKYDDDGKEYVKIEIEKGNESSNRERSLEYIECYIDGTAGVIELFYDNIGSPEVYIYDFNYNIVDYTKSEYVSDKLILTLPSFAGCYYIVIKSNLCIGQGQFIIW